MNVMELPNFQPRILMFLSSCPSEFCIPFGTEGTKLTRLKHRVHTVEPVDPSTASSDLVNKGSNELNDQQVKVASWLSDNLIMGKHQHGQTTEC